MADVHIIVVGCGRVGSDLAMNLSEDGHSVVVIDKNKDSFRRLTSFRGKTLVGSGFDREILQHAEASSADGLAAVTSGDNTNILCARIARDNYNIKNVAARIYDPARADIYMKLGIPTVATSTWTSQQVRRWILPSDDSVQWSDGLGLMHLVERVLPDALAGRELSSFNLSNDVRIAGLIRGGKARVDVSGLFAQEDDIVQFLVTNEGLASLHEFLKAGQA
jgi:trk system potassium uptake protein TrkA